MQESQVRANQVESVKAGPSPGPRPTRLIGWCASIFHSIECSGGPVPDGPVLVVANHPNSLLDPLILFRVAGRATRPLAKAPLFEQRFMGALLRLLGGLPVYRAQDDPTQMHRNEDTFRGAINALRAGDAVQIYPEGRSHSEPSLAQIRTGAARIAFGAEVASGWKLGLLIVPIGLTYRNKERFRGRVLATIGEPFHVADLRAEHEADPAEAVRALTDRIAAHLEALTFNVAEHRDAELIDTAERLYARERRTDGWRNSDPLAERLPRLQAFARGLEWLREHAPDRHQRLEREVARYRRRTQLLGASDGDIPPGYAFMGVLRYLVRQVALILLAVPALIGAIIWYPTWFAPRLTLRHVRPDFEAIATYKIATGFVMVPLTMVVCIIAGALLDGVRGAAIALVIVPICGFAALSWRERWTKLREDARLFFQLVAHRNWQQRMTEQRQRLAAEFDHIVEESGVVGRD